MFTCVHTNTHTTHGRGEKQGLAITETDNMPWVTWAHYKHYSTFNQNKPTVQTEAQKQVKVKFLVQGQVGHNSALGAAITGLTPDWNAQC